MQDMVAPVSRRHCVPLPPTFARIVFLFMLVMIETDGHLFLAPRLVALWFSALQLPLFPVCLSSEDLGIGANPYLLFGQAET